jgi:hypothetical protein
MRLKQLTWKVWLHGVSILIVLSRVDKHIEHGLESSMGKRDSPEPPGNTTSSMGLCRRNIDGINLALADIFVNSFFSLNIIR